MIKELDMLDSIIPAWKFDELIERKCPFCMSGNNEKRYIRPDRLSVIKCNICNTYFVSPSPSESQLNALYSKYDESFRINKVQQNDYAYLDPMDNIQIQEITSMIDLKGKECLDIGFGRGYFLRYFQTLGAEVYGVDLDPNAIYIAKKYLKIDSVIEGTVFDLDGNKKYDIVTINDLIEHPLDPDRVFSRICYLLKINGFLVMLTPNASFVDEEDQPIVFRKDLEHMQYCSFETCHFLARKYNLQIVHLESFGSPSLARAGNYQSRIGYAGLKKKIKNIIRPLPGYKTAKKICQHFKSSPRTGNYEILCIFRKSA